MSEETGKPVSVESLLTDEDFEILEEASVDATWIDVFGSSSHSDFNERLTGGLCLDHGWWFGDDGCPDCAPSDPTSTV